MRPNFRRAQLVRGCAMALVFALLLLRPAPIMDKAGRPR